MKCIYFLVHVFINTYTIFQQVSYFQEMVFCVVGRYEDLFKASLVVIRHVTTVSVAYNHQNPQEKRVE